MALRGNLRDFSLPDVFQLVTLSGKTGVLRIRRPDAEGSVWFRDGDVFFAQSDWHREPLGTRLVAAGRITPSALMKALDVQRAEPAGGRRLGQILVDEGYTAEKVLEAFVQEQIQDTIFDLFRWDEGDFDFETLEEAPEEDIGLSVSIENIVMEGSRRLDEWNRIKKKIPSMAIVFKMATAPGEGTFDISLKPVEWNLLLKIDGTRTVSDLARELNRTDFEVARIIYGLFSAGLLEVASDAEVERLLAQRTEMEAVMAADESRRTRSEESAPPVAQAPEPEPTIEEPAEEPAFLSVGQAVATPDDMAVFEQMMGAVLLTPPAAPPEGAPVAEVDLAPVPPVAEVDLAPVPPVAEMDSAPVPTAAEAGPTPMPTAAEAAPDQSAAAVEPDLADLLQTLGEPAAVAEPYPSEPASVSVPMAEPATAPQRTGDFETDLMALGLGEMPAAPAAASAPLIETPEPTIAEIEAAALAAASQGAGRVISTDAFLSDFDSGSVSLSTGLGDELTALTGGGRSRTRPTASISKPPEPSGGGPLLSRDMQVDRDLMLKVIEGVKKL